MKEIKRSTKIQMFKTAACILVAVVLIINTVLLYAEETSEGSPNDPTPSPTETIMPTEAPEKTADPTDPPAPAAAPSPSTTPESSDPTSTETPTPTQIETSSPTPTGTDDNSSAGATEAPTVSDGGTNGAGAGETPSVSPSASPSATPTPSAAVEEETVSELSADGGLPAGISNVTMTLTNGSVSKDAKLSVSEASASLSEFAETIGDGSSVVGSKLFDIKIDGVEDLPEGTTATVTVNFSDPIFKTSNSKGIQYVLLHKSHRTSEIEKIEDAFFSADLKSITFTTGSFCPFAAVAVVDSAKGANEPGEIDITQKINLADVINLTKSEVTVNNAGLTDGQYDIGTLFKFSMEYEFKESMRQQIADALGESPYTQEQVVFYYQMPAEIVTASSVRTGNIVSTAGYAGTYEIQEDGKVLFKFNSSFLHDNSVIKGTYDYFFRVDGTKVSEDNKVELSFPGTLNSIVIQVKKVEVNGWKNAQYDKDSQEITYTVGIKSGNRKCESVAIIDTPQTNLEIDYSSFTYVKKKGNTQIGKGTIPESDIQPGDGNFSINLGELEADTEIVVTYKAEIKDLTLDKNGDGIIDGLDNKLSWSINGEDSQGEVWAWPNVKKISTGSKSGYVEGQKIKWRVDLNTGDIKTDVSGKTYTDTMTSDNQKYDEGSFVIKDENWQVVQEGYTISFEDSKFTLTLPQDAGTKGYHIEYCTVPKTPLTIGDKVTVTNEGNFDGTPIKGDSQTIERNSELGLDKSASDLNQTDLSMSWTAVITPDEDGITDPVFTDYLGYENEYGIGDWTGSVFVGSPVVTYDGQTLAEGTDYDVTFEQKKNSEGNDYMTISFKGGKNYTKPITITYISKDITEWQEGTGKNIQNTCHVDNKWVHKNEYRVNNSGAVANGILKKPWNISYGNDGYYYTEWNIWVNTDKEWFNGSGLRELENIVIEDELPDGLEYVDGSLSVNARSKVEGENEYSQNSDNIIVAVEGQKIVATIKNVQHRMIHLWFKTKITKYGETITNIATYSQDGNVLGTAEGTVTTSADLLEKKGEKVTVSNEDLLEYTITVNKNAIKYLPGDSESLMLEDTLPANVELKGGSITFTDSDGTPLTDGTGYMYNAATRLLSIQVPDQKTVIVKYQVKPILDGLTPYGTNQYQFETRNTVILSGHQDIKAESWQKVEIVDSSATASGKKDEIKLFKVDAQKTEEALAGATFELYKMNTNSGATTRVDEKTTGEDGLIAFTELSFDTVYYYQETSAPSGYIVDPAKYFFIIKNTEGSGQDYVEAVNQFSKSFPGETLKTIPGGNKFTVTNIKRSTAEIVAFKSVTGAEIGDYEGKFRFKLTEVDKNGNIVENGHSEIASNAKDGSVKFGELSYEKEGNYYYRIEELKEPLVPGIDYDDNFYLVTVNVVKNAFTGFVTTVTYVDKEGVPKDVASFTNQKKGSITVKKIVEGESVPVDAEFFFTLKNEKTGTFVEQDGTTIHAIKNNGTIKFDKLEYGTYILTETDIDGNKVSTSKDFAYKVEKAEQTITISEKFEEQNPEAIIINTYYAPKGKWTPTAEKVFDQGKATYTPVFNFTISGYGVENGTATVNGSGSIKFETINYTGLDAVGPHEYEIKEVPVASDSIVYDPAIYKVTVNVIVDPDDANKLKADISRVTKQVEGKVEEISNNEVKFTNTYRATGDLELSATKKVNNQIPEDKFTFELYELENKDDTAEGKTPVETVQNDGESITFRIENKFNQDDIGQTFWYLIKEQPTNVENGYVPNTQSFKVSVLVKFDPEDKTRLTVQPTYYGGNVIFNNIPYEPDSVPVTAEKKLENGSIDEYRNRFRFNLYQITLNNGGTETKTLKQTVSNGEKENSAAGAIEFAPLNYTRADIGKTYTYEISEEGAENYFACDKKTVRFTVAVTYDAVNKKVVATPNYGENGTITFTNTYNPMVVSTNLDVNKKTKVPEGITTNLDNMTFTFVVKDSANNEVTRGTSGANGKISFKPINFTKGDTYYYTIEEVKTPIREDIKYDSKVIKAVVVVPDNHDGTLGTPTVKYYGENESGEEVELTQPEFVNEYNPKAAEIQFSGTKELSGRDWISGDEFTFGLWEGTTANGKPKYTATATEADHSFHFTELTFDKTDTYKYTVKEIPDEDATAKVVNGITCYTLNGITYDPQEYHVTVTVTDDGSGQLNAELSDDLIAENGFNFTNNYSASGKFRLAVFKTVNDQKPENDEKFTFQLYEKRGETETPVGRPIENAAFDNAKDKDIVLFDEIPYTEEGSHTYVIKETSTIDGYTNDKTVYTAVVTVTDKDHNGTFAVTCQYYAGESMIGSAESGQAVVTVNNTRPSDGEALIEARKDLIGGDLTKNAFTFTLSSTDDTNLASRGATLEPTTDGQGRVSFGPLKYTRADLKGAKEQTYTYTITEQNKGESYIDYDPENTRTVQVRVYLDGNAIKTKVSYGSVSGDLYANDSNAAVFHNTYKGQGRFSIEGTKTLTGGTQARNFTFDLYQKDTDETVGQLVKSVTINDVKPGEPATTFKFENVSINKIGDSTYVVKEHIPGGAVYNAESQTAVYEGVTYSTKEYKVIVHMDADGSGGYVQNAELTQYVDGPVAFTNEYKTTGTSIDIYGKKVLTGRKGKDLEAEEFTFGLYENNALVVNSVKNDEDGKFSFHIDYTGEGIHNYVVKEEIPQGVLDEYGKLNNIHYNATAVGDGYPVVVQVTDDNKGGLKAEITSAIGKTEQNPVTVTNSYEAELDVPLSATKTVNSAVPGNDERGRFAFTLSTSDGKEIQTVYNGTDGDLSAGSVIFAPIHYTQKDIGPHVYTVREVQGRPAGQETADTQKAEIYEYSDLIYKVNINVFVNENGELDNTIRYTLGEGESATSPTSITFDNQKHLPSALVLRAVKVLSGANGGTPTLTDNQFQFKLTSTGKNRDSRIPETGITASNNTTGEVIFETINYNVDDIGKTYQYTVEEMLPENAKQQQDGKWVYQGVTYDSNRTRTITVVVGTDEATGNVKPVMTCDDKGGKVSTDHGEFPKFENTYAASNSFTPSATKTLTGRNMNANEFKFVLEGEGVRQEAYNEAAKDGQPGKIGFTPITYTLSNVRTEPYIYTVREVKTEADPKPGVTYSDVVYTISVKVTDKGDGTLNIEDTYTYTPSTSTEATVEGKVMTFTNKYNATGSATLSGTKMLTGRDMIPGEFTFNVYEMINGKESEQPVTTGTNSSATDGNATTINFDPINYTLRNEKGEIIPGVLGDHTYIIKEAPSSAKGVAANNQEFTVVVNVTDGQNGQLNHSVKSIIGLNSKGEEINQIAFENTYTASANLDLQAVKTINNNGTPGDGEEFTFTLTGGRGEKTENQKKENIGGTITFDTITYDQNDAGGKPFIYEIKESENVPNGYHYDPIVYTVEVTVERDDTAENGLKINKVVKIGTTTPEDQTIKFNNTYPSNGEVQLVAYKDLQGGVIADGMFSFKLTDSDGNQIGETKPNDGQGKVAFDKIHYTKSDVGQEYTYTITEVKDPNKTGYVTYDTELTRTVTVVVGERDDQVVPTSITYSSGGKYEKDDKANKAIFHNTYKASGQLKLTATKVLNGRTLTVDDKFSFVVIDKNKKTDSVVATAVNNGKEIKFSAITYNQSQIGQEYEYVIKELELPSTDENIKCDSREYTLKVQVTDPNHNGTLVIKTLESDIPTDGMVFTNTYSASGKIGLTGTKILSERDMVAGEFTFNVYEVIDGKESKTPISTGTNDEKGKITFTPIKYELSNVGTPDEKDDRRIHEYHVREAKGNRPGITYTDDFCTIRVDVSDGEGSELKAKLTSDSEIIEFTNKYTPKEIWISKVDAVSLNELAGASMTITSEDGKVLDSWTSGSEKHVFKADYDRTYTLTETAAPKGYLIADSITFKINKAGQLLIKQVDGGFVQQADSVITMVDAAAPMQTPTPTPGATSTPSTTPGTTSTPGTTETPAPTATPGTTPEATATPSATPGTTPGATATPGQTPTPEITPAPENTPNPVVTPGNNPTPTPRGSVLGARKVRVGGTKAAVLGARRGADFAVLGKRRRPATGDSIALLIWIITMSVAMGGAVTSSVLLSLENGRKRRRRK